MRKSILELWQNKKVKVAIIGIASVVFVITLLQPIIENKLLDRKNELKRSLIIKYFTNSDIQIKLNASKIIVTQSLQKETLSNNFIYLQLRNGVVVNCQSNNSNFNEDYTLTKVSTGFLTNYNHNNYYSLELEFKSSEHDLLNIDGQKTGTAYSIFNIDIPTNIPVSEVEPTYNFWQDVYKLYKRKNIKYDLNLTSISGTQKYYSYTIDSNNTQDGQHTFYYFDMVITPSSNAINDVSAAPIRADNYEQIVAEEQSEYQSHIVVDTQSVPN